MYIHILDIYIYVCHAYIYIYRIYAVFKVNKNFSKRFSIMLSSFFYFQYHNFYMSNLWMLSVTGLRNMQYKDQQKVNPLSVCSLLTYLEIRGLYIEF